MEDKKISDLTDEELEDFMWNIKWQRFINWAKNLDNDEDAKKNLDEIVKRTGIKRTAPFVMMANSFFAGVEVGMDITKKIILDDGVGKAVN